MKRLYTLILFIFSALPGLFSQGKINTPAIECLGNITSFTYTPSSGLVLSSATWRFGDGATSTSLTPLYDYKATGTYIIEIDAVFTNGTSRTDSQNIQVVGVPRASFYLLNTSDSCLNNNIICYRDTSRPAKAGQDITKRLFVWGDGSFSQVNNPAFGSKLCHNYAVSDKYNVTMELTDKYGCKSTSSTTLSIVEDTEADFDVTTGFANCTEMQVCVKNLSTLGNPLSASYEWYVDTTGKDTNKYFSTSKCVRYSAGRKGNIALVVVNANGCTDTAWKSFSFDLDPLPSKLSFSDTVMCFSFEGLAEASASIINFDAVKWRIDNFFYPLVEVPDFYFSPKNNGCFPGKHNVSIEIVRANCSYKLSKDFIVKGPVADIKIFDNAQCFSNRPIYFFDTSRYVTPGAAKYYWAINDPFGSNCVANRLKDINLYKNCNNSIDWYHKHKFSASGQKYHVAFAITDTVTGCTDSAKADIDLSACPPILEKDTITVCQNNVFAEKIDPPYPKFFSIDNGQKWHKFPGLIDSSFKPGVYNVGYIFENPQWPWAENIGDDSVKIHYDTMLYYDTVFRINNHIKISELKKDSVYIKFYGRCPPFRATIYFKKGDFLKGEGIFINWYDGGPGGTYDTVFTSDEHIDSVSHVYKSVSVQVPLLVNLINREKCITSKRFDIAAGKSLYVYRAAMDCYGKNSCFTPSVFDPKTQRFWKKNSPYDYITWQFPDTTGLNTKFSPCYRFRSPGWQFYDMIVKDSIGCTYVYHDSVLIQKAKAGVKKGYDVIYCSELKQFFDSSSVFTYVYNDTISKYYWDFGTGIFSSLQKDPLQSLNLSLDTIHARHAVRTVKGCADTINFDIRIIGAKPNFQIRDTIGCGSLTATFFNYSKNCKSYIWRFGDSAGTILQTPLKQPVTFTYTKPGRYQIELVGIDTIYNPVTGAVYYCNNIFPNKIYQKDSVRAVQVLPLLGTGIKSIDTICIGSVLTMKSLSDSAYIFDNWYINDTLMYHNVTDSSITHTFTKAGTYQIKLAPLFTDSLHNLCRDSAEKSITVLNIKADFDIDPSIKLPQFLFHNKSVPAGSTLLWNFGHPQSGSGNTSADENPMHNYGRDTGLYLVCLRAALPYGCADTLCKSVYNNFAEGFKLYNVFTPGAIDNKNDQYDIEIEGEELYDLQIFNRWGELVFHGDKDGDNTQDINWNGKYMNKGAECPAGTYYYIFKYRLIADPASVHTVNGVITLIR